MNQKLSEIFSELGELENRRGRVFPSRVFYKTSRMIKDCTEYRIQNNRVIIKLNHEDVMLGPSCSEIIMEYLETNSCQRLIDLRKEFKIKKLNDEFIDELQRISGIGEVKARMIVNSNKFDDLDDFINRLPEVDEFICDGVRYTEMMETGVKLLKMTSGERLPWSDANKLANNIIYSSREKTNIDHYVYKLGSLRRMKETVGDIDLVVSDCDENKFSELRDIYSKELDSILVHGESKIAGIKNGFQVDIRFIPKKYLGAHILHGTGSQKFNILMRSYAKSLGMKLNEYGIYDQNGIFHCFDNEIEIFKYLKVKYVTPKDRSNIEYLEYIN